MSMETQKTSLLNLKVLLLTSDCSLCQNRISVNIFLLPFQAIASSYLPLNSIVHFKKLILKLHGCADYIINQLHFRFCFGMVLHTFLSPPFSSAIAEN